MKRTILTAIAAALVVTSTAIPSAGTEDLSAKRKRVSEHLTRSCKNVISKKTGATACVHPDYAVKFQAYVDELENLGATIRFMGGYASRRNGYSLHPHGKALDVCQMSRDRVDPRCSLPDRGEIARVAASHGLFEGGQWCNGDYGHVQAGETAPACGTQLAARKHRRHRQYASR